MTDEKKQKTHDAFEMIILGVVSIVFDVLAWKMIPINTLLKFSLFCIVVPIAFGVVVLTFLNLSRINSFFTTQRALITTIISFLLIPLIMNLMYYNHKEVFLESYPQDENVSLRIVCAVEKTGGKGNVGGDGLYHHYINDQKIKSGEVVTIGVETPFHVKTRLVEMDEYSDIGMKTSPVYVFSSIKKYNEPFVVSQQIYVFENEGKRNAGAYAEFSVRYYFTRVLPVTMTFWNLFLLANNQAEYLLCVCLCVGLVFSVLFIIFVNYLGYRKTEKEKIQELQQKKIAAEKEKALKEQEFTKRKEDLLNHLNGRTLRQAAGVPVNITFVNSLPKDNNDAPYGSFTVYRSKSGNCYHEREGCCSARYAIHFFNAKRQYKPCSKCCAVHRTIPQWYHEYVFLKAQAQKYKIDVSD